MFATSFANILQTSVSQPGRNARKLLVICAFVRHVRVNYIQIPETDSFKEWLAGMGRDERRNYIAIKKYCFAFSLLKFERFLR
jgi:hypothetical protein